MKKLLLSVTALLSLSIPNLEAFKKVPKKHAAQAAPAPARPAAPAPAPAPTPAAPVNPFADIFKLIEGLDQNKGDSAKNQADLRAVIVALHAKFTTLTAKDAKLLPVAVKVDMTRAFQKLSKETQALLKEYLGSIAYNLASFYESDPVVQELNGMQNMINACKEKMNGTNYVIKAYRWTKNHPKTSMAIGAFIALRTGVAIYNHSGGVDTKKFGEALTSSRKVIFGL